jgi:hypothetical protein
MVARTPTMVVHPVLAQLQAAVQVETTAQTAAPQTAPVARTSTMVVHPVLA